MEGAARASRKKSFALPWTESLLRASFAVDNFPSFTSSGAVCRMLVRPVQMMSMQTVMHPALYHFTPS